MKTEKETNNIPTVSVSDLVDKLFKIYSMAIKNNVKFINLPTPFLWGAAGVGKSSAIYELADKIESETDKTVKVTDIRLLLFSPVDLRGVPVADAERQFTKWLMPKIFDMNSSESVVNILFLDELSAAPQTVQAAAYQICLDRKIGEFRLPENCIVIAAGNRTTDQSVAYKMPKALCNRLMHFNVSASFEEWRAWAVENKVSPKVIGYLAFDNSRLCVEPESSDLAYCTPRSWVYVSNLLSLGFDDNFDVLAMIAACVGLDAAKEFEAFCKGCMNMPPVDEILKGRCTTFPKTHDVMYALVSSLVALLYRKAETVSITELENVCKYVTKLPNDFCMSFMKDINRIKDMNLKLMKCKEFQVWLSKNKKFL